MKSRVRFGFKPNAKCIVVPDVTIDCELDESDTVDMVGKVLNEAVVEFKKQAEAMNYMNAKVETK